MSCVEFILNNPLKGRERKQMTTIWDELKIKKLRMAPILCDFVSDENPDSCLNVASYNIETKYICSHCLIAKLMLEIYLLKHPPKGIKDNPPQGEKEKK